MESMNIERLSQSERINREIAVGNLRYLKAQIKENYKLYKTDTEVALEDFYVFRITALSASLLENSKYQFADKQMIVRQNSDKLKIELESYAKGLIDLAKMYPDYFDGKYNEAMFDEIKMGIKTSNDYFDEKDETISNNTLVLKEMMESGVNKLIEKYDAMLFRDLEVDEKTKATMKRDLETLKVTLFSDFNHSNIRLFENYVNMTKTFKKYVVAYEGSAKDLELNKKSEKVESKTVSTHTSSGETIKAYKDLEDYLDANIEVDYNGEDFELPSYRNRI